MKDNKKRRNKVDPKNNAGGRKLNAAEYADADEVIHQYAGIRDNLYSQGRKDEAIVLDQRVLDVFSEWQKMIMSTPEGSDTILFSECLVDTLAPYMT